MKKIYLIIAIFSAMFLTGCQEQDIQVFGTDHYVYFDKFWKDAAAPGTEKADSTEVTFFFANDDEDFVYADLVVVLAGRKLEKDLHFQLKPVEDMTTALPEEYTLEPYYTFRAMDIPEGATQIQDTIQIKLNRSERLENNTLPEGIRLVLEIVPNDEVKVGQLERRRAVLRVTKDPVKPDWWSMEVEENLLGSFSPAKYKLFLNNVEDADKLDATMIKESPDKARQMALDFKKWLSDNPSYDENGELITVPV